VITKTPNGSLIAFLRVLALSIWDADPAG